MEKEKEVPLKSKLSAWWVTTISLLGFFFVISALIFAGPNSSPQEMNLFLLQVALPVVTFSALYLFTARLILKKDKRGFWMGVSVLTLEFFLLMFLFFTVDNFRNLFAAFLMNLKAVPLILLIVDRRNFSQAIE